MFHACMHSISSSSHQLSLVAMAFVTFKQYSSFLFIIAILAALTTASSLSPKKMKVSIDLSQPLEKVMMRQPIQEQKILFITWKTLILNMGLAPEKVIVCQTL